MTAFVAIGASAAKSLLSAKSVPVGVRLREALAASHW